MLRNACNSAASWHSSMPCQTRKLALFWFPVLPVPSFSFPVLPCKALKASSRDGNTAHKMLMTGPATCQNLWPLQALQHAAFTSNNSPGRGCGFQCCQSPRSGSRCSPARCGNIQQQCKQGTRCKTSTLEGHIKPAAASAVRHFKAHRQLTSPWFWLPARGAEGGR